MNSFDIKYYPKLLEKELCIETEQLLNEKLGWNLKNMIAPKRLTTDIREFPKIENVINKNFTNYEYNVDHRCYFQAYERGEICKNHVDPTGYTLLVLIKKPENGGILTVEKQEVHLELGDGVLFKGNYWHSVSCITKGKRISLAVWFK